MDPIFSIFVALAAALGISTVLAGISLVIPGMSGLGTTYFSFLLAMFHNIFNFIRQIFQFLLDHLPKPLKLIIFVVLFTVLGAMIYNWTIGATYICADQSADKVIQVNWIQGIGVVLNPPKLQEKTFEIQNATVITGSQIENDTNTQGNAPATCDSFMDGTNTVIERVCNQKVDSSKYGEVNVNDAAFALAAQGDPLTQLGGDDYFEKTTAQVWDKAFGTTYMVYYVCMDRSTKVCILDTKAGLALNNLGGNPCGVIYGTFSQPVGTIYLTYDSTNGLGTTVTDKGETFGAGVWSLVGLGSSVKQLSSCQKVDSTVAHSLITTNPSATSEDAYFQILTRDCSSGDDRDTCTIVDPLTVDLKTAKGNIVPVPLYNTQYALSAWGMVTETGSSDWQNTTFQDLTIQPTGPGADSVYRDPLNTITVEDLFDTHTDYTYSPTDLIQYHCKEDPKMTAGGNEYYNAYATQLEIFGVNPFDPTIMYFFVFIGLLWSFYASYAGWWR